MYFRSDWYDAFKGIYCFRCFVVLLLIKMSGHFLSVRELDVISFFLKFCK